MARKYAAIKQSLFSDPSWRSLSTSAQHLYLVLLANPGLSYAGVLDWRPNRICRLASDWDEADVNLAAVELSDHGWIVIDELSEEVLVRSFLRHDSVLEQKHLSVSMIKAYGEVASASIRAAIIYELNRLHFEKHDLKCWSEQRMLEILAHPSMDGKALARQFEPRGVLSALAPAA